MPPVPEPAERERGFFGPVLGDGRPLLLVVAGSLIFAGGFALFLAAGGEFLPHDLRYLGMTADELCAVASCRVTQFMVHDRVAFGGTLLGLGITYVWLTVFPLAGGERWAWWLWLLSGLAGFATFLAYIGYGYLDTWHGVATLVLLPIWVLGMVRSRRVVGGVSLGSISCLLDPGDWWARRDRFATGRVLLIAGAAAVAGGGLVILRIGVGDTFVPEDLAYIGMTADELRAVNPRLVPLLAHDRAGFGGGVVTLGLTTLGCLWCSSLSRHVHQAVALAGVVSLSAALLVHVAVGYLDALHLAPPLAAALSLVAGLAFHHPGTPGASRSR
jgi:hypothetical protein